MLGFGMRLGRAGPHAGALTFNKLVATMFANGEVGFWYDHNDFSTLFQDAAGTIPVTAADQPVGLQLDKSKGLVLGAEIVNNGGFGSDTAWSKGANWTISDGKLSATGASAFSTVTQMYAFTTGRLYKVSYTIAAIAEGSVRLSLFAGTQKNGTARSTVGTFEEFFFADGNTSLGMQATSVFSGSIDNVSIRELPGNHRYQAAAASRPMLRYNSATGSYYLQYDGTDDFLVTSAINFTTTDSVSVFAGVRKLSDAATGGLLELSTNSTATVGTFGVFAPIAAGASFQFRSGGTLPGQNAGTGVGEFPAPYSAVIVGVADISSDSALIRVNGVVEGTAATDQGTGNYGNHPMYFGRRGGTSLPFNGHEYSQICVGRLTTAAEIANVERLLARQVGVVLP